MKFKKFSKILLVILLISLLGAFVFYDLGRYLNLDYLKSQKDAFLSLYQENPSQFIFTYVAIYILSVALSLPGAAILTLAAGALFGVALGTLIVSFASTIGATLAFLASRFLLRESIQEKFGDKLKTINEGMKKEGGFYLFTLRLIPIVPFFIINLVMGLTPISVISFFFISQVGMLLGTLVYVNAGTQLAQINSLSGILSPAMIASFAALGLLPLVSKFMINSLKAKKVYKGYKKPKSFDYNIIAIGAGSAGLVTTYIGAAIKAKVLLVEKEKMGGDCLNTGCVPSKAIIQSAKLAAHVKRHKEFGFKGGSLEFDWQDIMARVARVIKKIEPHDSVERYTGLGVECLKGTAFIKSPFEVEVDGKVFTTKNIVIATGARPLVPPFKGLDKINYYTSDNIWAMKEQPKRLLVLGGGPIGCELTQAFQRLGTSVTQVEMAPKPLIREDDDVSQFVVDKLKKEGVDIRAGHKAVSFGVEGHQKYLLCEHEGKEVRIDFDQVLIAIGRQARVTGFGLEELGITLSKRGTIEVNEYLQTKFPNIYVCGDAAGPYQFTHAAAHQAWFASVNSLFAPLKKFKVDYRVLPWVTFTDPEIARVGLSEKDAIEKGIPYEVTTFDMEELDRAICDEEDHGLIKVLTVPGKDKILGATVVSAHGGEIITEFVAAIKNGYGMNRILSTVHSYPTWSEGNKYAAGNWKKARKPEKVLSLLERFHRYRRG